MLLLLSLNLFFNNQPIPTYLPLLIILWKAEILMDNLASDADLRSFYY